MINEWCDKCRRWHGPVCPLPLTKHELRLDADERDYDEMINRNKDE